MVVFDSTFMLLLMCPRVKPPNNDGGLPVEHAKERIGGLVGCLEKGKKRIIIPTPVLSELLVDAGNDALSILRILQKSSVFSIEPFDEKAAIEWTIIAQEARTHGNKRGGVDSPWAKVKFDWQIVAIAKAHGAATIYSDDKDIHSHAGRARIEVLRLNDIPVPHDKLQEELQLEPQS